MSLDDYPGPGWGAASLLYRNDSERFPEFAGRDLHTRCPGIAFVPLARDGATTHEVLASLETLKDQPGRVLFSLTGGRNDLLRGRLRDLSGAVPAYRARLEQIFELICARYAGRARIVVSSIYDPSDGIGDLMTPGTPNPGLVRLLQGANDAIRTLAATRPEVVVADAHAHFLGHGSHATDPAHPSHDPADPRTWLKLGIEPNERGGSEVRRVLWGALCAAEGWPAG